MRDQSGRRFLPFPSGVGQKSLLIRVFCLLPRILSLSFRVVVVFCAFFFFFFFFFFAVVVFCLFVFVSFLLEGGGVNFCFVFNFPPL